MTYYTVRLEQLIWWNGPSQLPIILNKIDQEYNRDKSLVVVGNLLWETFYPVVSDFVLFLEEVKKRNIPIVIVVNFKHKYNNSQIVKKISELGIGIIYVDFFHWRVYQEIIVKKKNKTNLLWNRHADKFLCLTGKPNRLNRVGLLWKLYKKDLLKHGIWSLYVPDTDYEEVIDILKVQGANKAQAEQFIKDYQCVPDDADIIFWPSGGSHYGGIPYAESLYSDVKFRVVSETSFAPDYKIPYLTEKTWLTIVNRCPFIMAGDRGSLSYIESKGFRTFKEYLEIPDYDEILDPQDRLDAIVTNVESWLKRSDLLDSIQQDVEHNYNRFIQIGEDIENDLLAQMKNNGLHSRANEFVSTDDAVANLAKK